MVSFANAVGHHLSLKYLRRDVTSALMTETRTKIAGKEEVAGQVVMFDVRWTHFDPLPSVIAKS